MHNSQNSCFRSLSAPTSFPHYLTYKYQRNIEFCRLGDLPYSSTGKYFNLQIHLENRKFFRKFFKIFKNFSQQRRLLDNLPVIYKGSTLTIRNHINHTVYKGSSGGQINCCKINSSLSYENAVSGHPFNLNNLSQLSATHRTK